MNVYIWELYKEVEYIQSSPTNPWGASWTYQCIDTWYIPTLNTEISIDIQLTSTANQSTLFWEITTDTSYLSFISYINGSNHWWWYMRNWNSWGTTDTNVTVDTNRHTFVVNKSTYKIYTNWTQVYSGNNWQSPSTNWNQSLFLLCNRQGTSRDIYAAAKLYWCKIWDNWTLVRDFIPCYRLSDNEIWLFDKVENKFYTNAGTGSFTKWADVKTFQPSLLNAYIGEYIEEITETYSFTVGNNPAIYKSWYTIKSVVLEWDYSNPSSWWTGWSLGVGYTSNSVSCYFRWWSNSSYMSYSAWKLNVVNNWTETKLYDIQAKNYTNTTTHMKVSIDREKVMITVGSNSTETYLYTSGSQWPHINSILDNSWTVAYSWLTASMWSWSNLTAVVTYEPN